MAPFGGYRPFHVNPQYYSFPYNSTYYHSADPYPYGSGLSTVTHPPQMQESCSPSWNPGKASAWIVARYGLSIDTLQNYVPRMERRLVCHCVKSKPHHTFPDASYLSGCGLSTVTHPPGISGRFSSFGTIRPPQCELQPQSVIPGDPHLSDPSSVRH